METYLVRAQVFHDKDNPYWVSSHEYIITSESEEKARKMADSEVRTMRYHKHNLTVDEINTKEKGIRKLGSVSLENHIIASQAVEDTIDEYAVETLGKAYRTKSECSFSDLLKSPKRFYDFIKDSVESDSAIFVHGGKLCIYSKEGKRGTTIFEREISSIRDKLVQRFNESLDELADKVGKDAESKKKRLNENSLHWFK